MADTEKLGQAIDRIESLVYGLQLPLPDSIHVEGIKGSLPEILQELKEGYTEATGENPWQ